MPKPRPADRKNISQKSLGAFLPTKKFINKKPVKKEIENGKKAPIISCSQVPPPQDFSVAVDIKGADVIFFHGIQGGRKACIVQDKKFMVRIVKIQDRRSKNKLGR